MARTNDELGAHYEQALANIKADILFMRRIICEDYEATERASSTTRTPSGLTGRLVRMPWTDWLDHHPLSPELRQLLQDFKSTLILLRAYRKADNILLAKLTAE